MSEYVLPIISINRHRIGTDGNGVTTLVAAFGCSLRCEYCLNPIAWDPNVYSTCRFLTPAELYERVKIDSLYFKASGGGVTFGGGEALLHTDFIRAFKPFCEEGWNIAVETALHVPKHAIESVLDVVDEFIIDVKTDNEKIYKQYTGQNSLVWNNLKFFQNIDKKVTIKVPFIEGFTTWDDVHSTSEKLKEMGFDNVVEVVYYNKEQVQLLRKKLYKS